MAWIKLDHFTPDKPELIQVSAILSIDQDAVLGKCIRLWIWADQQSVDGNAISVTKAFLDRLVSCNGFTDSLKNVGWLREKNGVFSFPNFERHNGESAKKRAETGRRVALHRKSSNVNVTENVLQKALPDQIRSDKSRSDQENKETPPAGPSDKSLRAKRKKEPTYDPKVFKVYDFYKEKIAASKRKADALLWIFRRSEEHGFEKLIISTAFYRNDCNKKQTEDRFKKDCANFFGEDAAFEGFLPNAEHFEQFKKTAEDVLNG